MKLLKLVLLISALTLGSKSFAQNAVPTPGPQNNVTEGIECLPNNPFEDVVYLNITKVRAWGWMCSIDGKQKIQRIVVLKSNYSSASCIRKMESFIKLNKDYNKAEQLATFKSTLLACNKPFISDEDRKLKLAAEKEINAMVAEYEMFKASKTPPIAASGVSI